MWSRDAYIRSPVPIQSELLSLFAQDAALNIFDIGACEGEDSIRYARLFPKSTIYACEPLLSNLAAMSDHFARYGVAPRVRVVPKAVSHQAGKAQFFVSSGHPEHLPKTRDWDYGNKSSSLYPPGDTDKYYPWLHFNESLTIETTTLARIAEEYALSTIDFMHIDVQGAELDVLHGAGGLLGSIGTIWMEVEAVPLYRGQPLRKTVEAFMRDNGFLMIKDTVGDVTGDQLYINCRVFPHIGLR